MNHKHSSSEGRSEGEQYSEVQKGQTHSHRTSSSTYFHIRANACVVGDAGCATQDLDSSPAWNPGPTSALHLRRPAFCLLPLGTLSSGWPLYIPSA